MKKHQVHGCALAAAALIALSILTPPVAQTEAFQPAVDSSRVRLGAFHKRELRCVIQGQGRASLVSAKAGAERRESFARIIFRINSDLKRAAKTRQMRRERKAAKLLKLRKRVRLCRRGKLFSGDSSSSSSGQSSSSPDMEGCGNGRFEREELCECGADGRCGTLDDDTLGASCQSFGASSGTLACSSSCRSFNQSGCVFLPGSWTPPVGIPRPQFGIEESCRMYDDPARRNPELTYSLNSEGGYYTHYVDNTAPSATDTGNPYGTAANPRMTIPGDLPQGAVVEVHGGPYAITGNPLRIQARGSAAYPVFIKGFGKPTFIPSPSEPRLNQLMLHVTYGIFEGFELNGAVLRFDSSAKGGLTKASFLGIRYNTIKNASSAGIATSMDLSDDRAHDIVIYNNLITDLGDWQLGEPGHECTWNPADGSGLPKCDEDYHAVAPVAAPHVWIVDNELARVSGDGIQLGTEAKANGVILPHHIYIGRNLFHHNKQAGVAIKYTRDLVISQNTCHDQRPIGPRPSAWGVCYANTNYEAYRTWFLFNYARNSDLGIQAGGSCYGDETYVIGNVLYDLTETANEGRNCSPINGHCALSYAGPGGAGIFARNCRNIYVYNNTIYNTDHHGIVVNDNGPRLGEDLAVLIRNNVISKVVGYPIFLTNENNEAARSSDLKYNFFDTTGALGHPLINWAKAFYAIPQFQAAFAGKGEGLAEGEARYVDAPGQNFRPSAASPLIDSGTSDLPSEDPQLNFAERFRSLYGLDIAVDIEGKSRPRGAGWDIGAYEF